MRFCAQKIPRRVAVFAVYIPPILRVGAVKDIFDSLSDEIVAVKTALGDPLVLIGRDFNRRDLEEVIGDVDNFVLLETGPTREGQRLNEFHLNFGGNVIDKAIVPPLQTPAGASSDHGCIFFKAHFPPERQYHWTVRWSRKRLEQA